MRRFNRSHLIAAGIMVVAILWVVSGLFTDHPVIKPGTALAPDAVERPLQSVRIRKLQAQPMTAELIIPGQTSASRTVTLKAEVAGPVEEVVAQRGSRVTAGQPILRIASQAREARLQEARARLSQRQLEFEAARKLEDKGFNSRVRLTETRASFDQAQSELRQAELDVKNLVIRAPFDGVLEDRTAEVGNFLDIGNPVATVVDLDPIRIVAYATERDIGLLDYGAVGHARLLDDRLVEGRITYLSASAQEATRTFRIELDVANTDLGIVDGLTAELRLPYARKQGHLVSPGVLTLGDKGSVGVKTVDDAGIVSFVTVRILGTTPDGSMWLEGLADRVNLVVVGQDSIVPGQKVLTQEVGPS
jgi:membrane fusion protein, multidrug efflux system